MYANACAGFLGDGSIVYNTLIPLTAGAAVFSAFLFAIVYMLGTVLQNPRLTVWAKGESMQVVVSLSALLVLVAAMNSFCGIDANSIREMFGAPASSLAGTPANLFDEAEAYLVNSVDYAHYSMKLVRSYLSAYSIMIYRNEFSCSGSGVVGGLACLFGSSGESFSSFANYGGRFGTMNMLFTTTIFYFFTATNMLFILLFVYKGFIVFFMPLAIILRSLPYMRALGSLMLAVCLSFFIVYPLTLAVFSLITTGMFEQPLKVHEDQFKSVSGLSELMYGSIWGALGTSKYTDDGELKKYLFPEDENIAGVLDVVGRAFVLSFMLPSLALATAVASVRYFGRLYGEDVDLSRISQLV